MAKIFGGGYKAEVLKAMWRKLLTNQFHDILPGTSIHEAMEDCRVAFNELLKDANEEYNNTLYALTKNIEVKKE